MADNFAELFVQITARIDKLERGMDEAEKKVVDKVDQINAKAQINPFSGIVGAALRAVTAMGVIELGLGSANVASKIFSGNIEEAASALEQLPAGIGPVARQLRELLGTLTGWSAETKRINEQIEVMNAAMAIQSRVMEQHRKTHQEIADIVAETNRRVAQAGLQGPALEVRQINDDAQRQQEAMGQERETLEREMSSQSGLVNSKEWETITAEVRRTNEEVAKYKDKLAKLKSQDAQFAAPLLPDVKKQLDQAQREYGAALSNMRRARETFQEEIQQKLTKVDTASAGIEAERNARIKAFEGREDQFRRGIERQIELSATEDPRVREEKEVQFELEDLRARADQLELVGYKERADKLRALAQTIHDQKIRDIGKQIQEEADAMARRAELGAIQDPHERDRRQADLDLQDQLDRANAAEEAGFRKHAEKMRSLAQAEHDRKLKDIGQQVKEEADARARRLKDLDSQIEVQQLRGSGHEGEARLAEIRHRYDQEIALATDAEEKKRLEILQTYALDQEKANQKNQRDMQLRDVQDRNDELLLQAGGHVLESQLLAIHHRFEKLIKDAQKQGDAKLEEALNQQEMMEQRIAVTSAGGTLEASGAGGARVLGIDALPDPMASLADSFDLSPTVKVEGADQQQATLDTIAKTLDEIKRKMRGQEGFN